MRVSLFWSKVGGLVQWARVVSCSSVAKVRSRVTVAVSQIPVVSRFQASTLAYQASLNSASQEKLKMAKTSGSIGRISEMSTESKEASMYESRLEVTRYEFLSSHSNFRLLLYSLSISSAFFRLLAGSQERSSVP